MQGQNNNNNKKKDLESLEGKVVEWFDRHLRVGSHGAEDQSTWYNFQVILEFFLLKKVLRNFEGHSCMMGSTDLRADFRISTIFPT